MPDSTPLSQQLVTVEQLGVAGSAISLALSKSVSRLSVSAGTPQAVRDALTTAATLGISEVLVAKSFTHDDQGSITVPTGSRLAFAPGVVVTVPANISVDVVHMQSKTELVGLFVEGNGANKGVSKYAVTCDAGATDLVLRDVSTNNWHGAGIRFFDVSRVKIYGGRHTNMTRTGDEGCGVHISAQNADVVDVLIDGVTVENTTGGGIQLDGDWYRSDWRTAGVKIRQARVVNCWVRQVNYAGVFINSGFDCVVANCTVEKCGDIGVDYEFCLSSTVVGCTARFCGNFGFASYQAGEGIAFSACMAERNGTGFAIHHGEVIPGSDGGPTSKHTLDGCVAINNSNQGFLTQELVDQLIFSGCFAIGNGDCGFTVQSATNVSLSACHSGKNNNCGINASQTDHLVITGGSIYENKSDGVILIADGGNQSVNSTITGVHFYSNVGSAIHGSPDTIRCRVVNCVVDNHLDNNRPAIYLEAGAGHLVSGCIFTNNARALFTTYGREITWVDNTFYLTKNATAMEWAGSGPVVPGGRVARNVVYGVNDGDTGFRIQAGTTNAGVAFFEDNEFINVATWVQWIQVGQDASSKPIYWRGRVPVTPNGFLYAAVGSQVTWTGGAAGTTLWVKETGNNTNTGWVGK